MTATVCAGLCAVLVMGCGVSPSVTGGISGTGVTSGPITGFGSAFVTDVEWDLDDTQIEIDGSPATEAQLGLGMVVRVEGDLKPGATTASAIRLVADDSIEGPIDATPTSPSPNAIEFTIFGFPVRAELGATVFDDGASFDGLMADDVIEVYGLPDASGTIVATRIELKGTVSGGATEAELKGLVDGLSLGSDTFMIGGITIDYDGTTVFQDGLASEDDLANGIGVEVKGTRVGATQIQALVIEREDGVFGDDDENAEAKLRGFVANLVGDQLTISGVSVDVSEATFDPPGLVLSNDDYVEVEGRLRNGVLVAREVELENVDDRDGDSVEIEARVPVGGKGAFGADTLGMLVATPGVGNGIQVQVNGGTRYDDKRDDVAGFGYADIADGDWLEIRAVAVDPANGIVVATRIERDDEEEDVIFQGPVTNASSTSFEILGHPIGEAGGAEYRLIGDVPTTRTGFFGAVDVDVVVKVQDDSAANLEVLGPADELEIEAFTP